MTLVNAIFGKLISHQRKERHFTDFGRFLALTSNFNLWILRLEFLLFLRTFLGCLKALITHLTSLYSFNLKLWCFFLIIVYGRIFETDLKMVLFKVSFSRFRHSARVNWSVKVYDLKRTHHSLFLVHVLVHRNVLFELLGQFSLGTFDLRFLLQKHFILTRFWWLLRVSFVIDVFVNVLEGQLWLAACVWVCLLRSYLEITRNATILVWLRNFELWKVLAMVSQFGLVENVSPFGRLHKTSV